MPPHIQIKFDQHGLGDCVHAVLALQLYRKRGYRVTVQTEANKDWLWRAAGVEQVRDAGLPNHPYHYLPSLDAFFDLNLPDHSSSKIAGFFEHPALPRLGDKQAVWDELCRERLDVSPHISPEAHAEADAFLDGLPRPIFVLHSTGSNWSREKSIPTAVAFDLILDLLDSTPGSVIVLDYDRRAPMVGDARCKGIIPAWGHIGLDRLCALLLRADLTIGIDSGPFHVAGLLGVKSLGVFRKIPPVRCCLPHPNTTYLVSEKQHDQWQNRQQTTDNRQRLWAFTEYSGDEPMASEIALVAARLASGGEAGPHAVIRHPAITGRYLYRRINHDERAMDLLPDGTIGEGSAGCERTWQTFMKDGSPVLQIRGDHGTICECQLEADGIFRGRWLKFERMRVELIPTWRTLPASASNPQSHQSETTINNPPAAVAQSLLSTDSPTLAASATDLTDGNLHHWTPEEASKSFPGYHPAWNLPVGSRGNGLVWLLDPRIERSDLDACSVDHEDWMFPHLEVGEANVAVSLRETKHAQRANAASRDPVLRGEASPVCLDLASFVGTVAVWWAKQGVQVIAVEPIPAIRDTLYRNLLLNQVADRVTVIPKAFGDRVGQAAMQVNSFNSMLSDRGDCRVDLTTIDAELLPTLRRLDIIKLDVEGAECVVIDGARETIKRFKPKLIVEVHSHLPGCEENGSILTRQFEELGYRSRRIWQNTDAYYYIEAVPND